jgi:hypothetical protein
MTSGAQGAADVTPPTIIEVVTGGGSVHDRGPDNGRWQCRRPLWSPVAGKVKVGLAGKPPSGSGWDQRPEKYARLTSPLHDVWSLRRSGGVTPSGDPRHAYPRRLRHVPHFATALGRVRCRTRLRSERVRLPQLVTRSLAANRVKTPPFWVSCFMWSAAQKVIAWMVSVGL